MEGKRLDLDAPLISVRRITASVAPSKDAKPQSRRVPLRSGNVENSGAVPFIWEKMPGHPKDSSGDVASGSAAAPNLPPGRILINALQRKSDAVLTPTPVICSSDWGTEKLMNEREGLNRADCGEECDALYDAWDTLSCNEFSTLKSGVTGLSVSPGFRDSTSQFSKDLQMEEYMMGRFLPAAQAMASGSPQRTWKKPPRAPVVDNNFERKTLPRRRLPLHSQFQLSVAASHDNVRKEGEEDEEEEEDSEEIASNESTGYFSSMARGLITRFGLKSSLCLLNPVPGMKLRDLPPTKLGHMSSHRIKLSNDEGIVQDSWEAVYRHRLRNAYIQRDVDSKSRTDSQTPDGSSSFHRSPSDGLSPNKNEDVKKKSKSSKTGSLDSAKEDIGSYWETTSSIGRMHGSGSTSPATARTHINSSQLPGTLNSNSSLVSMTESNKENTDSATNGYAVLSKIHRTEESDVAETSGGYPQKAIFSGLAEPRFSSYSKTLNSEDKKYNGFKNSQSNDLSFDLKTSGQEKNIDNSLALSLLPPPLPKPPSDSWLQRTVPSISAKSQQSFSGIQFHPMNQTLQASRGGRKIVIPEKSSKRHSYQKTFAGVPKPAS